MSKLIDLMFYVGYLRVKKNESNRASPLVIAHITLLGMGVHGFLFFNGLFSLIGVAVDLPLADMVLGGLFLGLPVIFLNTALTMLAYYFYSIKSGRYLEYSKQYPEINSKNLDKYDQKYLLTPAVIGMLTFLVGLILPFVLHRGV